MDENKSIFKKIKLLFFIGFKFLNINKKGKLNLIFFVLFVSISIGLMTLIVVIGIMNGLQENHILKRIEVGSYHIVIKKNQYKNFTLPEANVFIKELYDRFDEIQAAVPYIEKEIIMKIKGNVFINEQIIKMRAVDPVEINKDKNLIKYFKLKENSITLGDDSIILGKELYDRIDAEEDTIVYLTPDISISSYKKEGFPFHIETVFKSNSYDYDRYWSFISTAALEKLTGRNEVDSIGIKLKDLKNDIIIMKKIKKFLGNDYQIKSTEEINRGYFTALKLEKIMILVLFYLIFFMISINTFGALKLKVIEKKVEVGILKAIGLSSLDVKILFLINGIVISLLGALFGNIFGFLVVYNITNIFKFFERIVNGMLFYLQMIFEKINPNIIFKEFKIYDETIYYQSGFPVKFDFQELLLINFIIIMMTIAASYLPATKISRMKPVEIIKNK